MMHFDSKTKLAVDVDVDCGALTEFGTASRVMALLGSLAGLDIIAKLHATLRASCKDIIPVIKDRGFPVFADLKLHDTPRTMCKDAKWISTVRPDYVTAHCLAGLDALRALRDNLPPEVKVIGVTVLTSSTPAAVLELFGISRVEATVRLTRMAMKAGLDGVTSPPEAISRIRFGEYYRGIIVAPSCAPEGTVIPDDDQYARATPKQLMSDGANMLVVGRAVTLASDPRQATQHILEHIGMVLET